MNRSIQIYKFNKVIMSEIFDSIQVSKEIEQSVDLSFDITDKIHAILERQGKTHQDLAKLLDKNESEISVWLAGLYNFTLKDIAEIQMVLGEELIYIPK